MSSLKSKLIGACMLAGLSVPYSAHAYDEDASYRQKATLHYDVGSFKRPVSVSFNPGKMLVLPDHEAELATKLSAPQNDPNPQIHHALSLGYGGSAELDFQGSDGTGGICDGEGPDILIYEAQGGSTTRNFDEPILVYVIDEYGDKYFLGKKKLSDAIVFKGDGVPEERYIPVDISEIASFGSFPRLVIGDANERRIWNQPSKYAGFDLGTVIARACGKRKVAEGPLMKFYVWQG